MINGISVRINQIDCFVTHRGNTFKTWELVVHQWNIVSLEFDLSIDIENMVIGPSNGQQYILCISNTINLNSIIHYFTSHQ